MIARITFRSEIFIEGENLEEIARTWERMELFSEEANQCEACQLEVVSVEDEGNDYEDITSQFNSIV